MLVTNQANRPEKTFHAYYEEHGIAPEQRRLLEEIRTGCPAREVGGGSGNTLMRLFSQINAEARTLESTTCEGVLALEMELQSSIFAYFCQPRIHGVPHVRNGRRHVGAATLDLLVYGELGPRIIECKPADKLSKLVESAPEQWARTAESFTNLAHQAWSRENGIAVDLWTPPKPPGIYLSNLQLLYAVRHEPIAAHQAHRVHRLLVALTDRPMTIDEALRRFKGLSLRTIWQLIATAAVHGPTRTRPIDAATSFVLFAESERARALDRSDFEFLETNLNGIADVASPLILATTVDYARARARLERVVAIEAGTEPSTRRMTSLVKRVRVARANGTPPLEVCLTSYATSGNRTPRLSPSQEAVIAKVISDRWMTGEVQTKTDLYTEVDIACKQAGLGRPARSTVDARLKLNSMSKRAMAIGGRKAYHAAKDPSDPSVSTVPASHPWMLVHIDSTKWDQRLDPGVLANMPFECPTLYVAIDGIGRVLARAIPFGPSCRDHLGLLFRNMVKRHGRVPLFVMADGGSEYLAWLHELLDFFGIGRHKPPTANPTTNSEVENAFKQLNFELAHKLPGSTLPDRKGRSVDNRFKSYNNAKMAYVEMVKLVDAHLFDMNEKPRAHQPGGPNERAAFSGERVGLLGKAVEWNDEFLFMTSAPIKRDLKPIGTTGMRYEGRTYRGEQLSALLATQKPVQCRRDCADPTLMWVKFKGVIVRARSRDTLATQFTDDLELLFDAMSSSSLRRHAVETKQNQRKAQRLRVNRSIASMTSKSHEMPDAEPTATNSAPKPADARANDWSSDVDPFQWEDK